METMSTGGPLPERFHQTMTLRWYQQDGPERTWLPLPRLQQLWAGSNGGQNWVDVPTVKE